MVVSYQWCWMVASKCPYLSAMVSYYNNLVNRGGQLSAIVIYKYISEVVSYKYNLVISNGKMSGVWSNISGVWSVL